MGIVAECTVCDDPFAGPMGDTLAVRAAHPILFLSKMTPAAKLVRVVHIDFQTRFRFQKITRVLFMACKTGQRPFLTAMLQDDNTVGHLSSPFDGNGSIVVTLTALKPLQFILAGFRPEGFSPVAGLYKNHTIRRCEVAQRIGQNDVEAFEYRHALLNFRSHLPIGICRLGFRQRKRQEQ